MDWDEVIRQTDWSMEDRELVWSSMVKLLPRRVDRGLVCIVLSLASVKFSYF